MHQSSNGLGNRRGDFQGDRTTANLASVVNPLQQEAGSLLTDRASMGAFQSRISPSGVSAERAAHNIGSSDDAANMNASSEQVQSMLELNPINELFDSLKNNDRDAALKFAESNQEVQTHALHSGDKAFSEALRLRLTGNA